MVRLGAAVVGFLLVVSSVAYAQPGAGGERNPAADGLGPPPPITPAPDFRLKPPPAQVEMTAEDRETYIRGEIGLAQYITGGVLAYAVGFGIGHAVQGRWTETGWMYTLGDAAALTGIIAGSFDCNTGRGRREDCGLFTASLVGFFAIRIVQIVDAWVAPPRHNRRVRAIRDRYRLDYAVPYRASFHVSPTTQGGMTGGVSVSF